MVLSSAEKSAAYRARDIEGYRARKRAYAKTPEQRKKRTEYMRKYSAKHREKMNELARQSHRRAYRRRTPEQRHAEHIWRTYRLTREQFFAILAEQKGLCLICKIDKPRGSKNWHVDHCHATGRIRGLLCNMCNPRLGWYETYATQIREYLSQ